MSDEGPHLEFPAIEADFPSPVDQQFPHIESMGHNLLESFSESEGTHPNPPSEELDNEGRRAAALSVAQSLGIKDYATLLEATEAINNYLRDGVLPVQAQGQGGPSRMADWAADGLDPDPGVTGLPTT